MNERTKSFHIGDILSVTTGVMVSPSLMGGVCGILDWMTDEDLMTHQLLRVSDECEPFLRETFPELAALEIPTGAIVDEATMLSFLASLEPEFGTHREVPRLPKIDHTAISPVAEIKMKWSDL